MSEDQTNKTSGPTSGEQPQRARRTEPTAPTFPLTRDQFACALAHGLGRVRLHLERCGAAGMEDLILDACVHNRSYDPQCENDRASWLDDLLVAGRIEQQVLPLLIAAVSRPAEASDRDTLHACGVAGRLAARGHAPAREALYAAFRLDPERTSPFGTEEIIAVDGPAGLVFVADAIGAALAADPAQHVDEHLRYLLRFYDELHGDGQARLVLEETAATHPHIRLYLDRLDQVQRELRTAPPELSFDEVIHEIDHPHTRMSRFRLWRWGEKADEAELRTVAQRLSTATDPAALRNCLICFWKRVYPRARRQMMELAGHPAPEVRRAALSALAEHADADVRALAVRRIRAGHVADGVVRLLERNYATGDHELLAQALCVPTDPDTLHGVAQDVLAVLEANPSPGVRTCALMVYEYTPCSLCRSDAVRLLVEQNQAPPWLIEEGRFDADSHTRALCAGAPPKSSH
jgi:hypothetical protein